MKGEKYWNLALAYPTPNEVDPFIIYDVLGHIQPILYYINTGGDTGTADFF